VTSADFDAEAAAARVVAALRPPAGQAARLQAAYHNVSV
jgi:hypothetical protein